MESIPPDFDQQYLFSKKTLRECRKAFLKAKKDKISAVRSAKSTKNPKLKKEKLKLAKQAEKEFEKCEKEFNLALEEKNRLQKINGKKRELNNEPVHYEKFGKPDDINTTWNVFYTTMQYLHRGDVDKNCKLVCRWWNDLILKGTNHLPLRTIEELCYGFSKTNPYRHNNRWYYQYVTGLLRDPLTAKTRNNGLRSCAFKRLHVYLSDDKFYKGLKKFMEDYGKKLRFEEVKLVFPEQGGEVLEGHMKELYKIFDTLIISDHVKLILGESSDDAWEDMVDARSFSYLLTKPSLLNFPSSVAKIDLICNDIEYHGDYDTYRYEENTMMRFLSGEKFSNGQQISLRVKHHSWNRNFGASLARLFLDHPNPEKLVGPIITEEYVGYEHVWLTLQYLRERNIPCRSKRTSSITTYEAERKDGWMFVMDYFSKRYSINIEFMKFSFRPPKSAEEKREEGLNQRVQRMIPQVLVLDW